MSFSDVDPEKNPEKNPESSVQLTPSYRLPLVVVLVGLPLAFWLPWVGLLVAGFGVFLLLQTAWIRLTFTTLELEVSRRDAVIRRFPYQDWQTWEIFWHPLPTLFYFREVNSIHFLPMLFDPTELRTQLQRHCGHAVLPDPNAAD